MEAFSVSLRGVTKNQIFWVAWGSLLDIVPYGDILYLSLQHSTNMCYSSDAHVHTLGLSLVRAERTQLTSGQLDSSGKFTSTFQMCLLLSELGRPNQVPDTTASDLPKKELLNQPHLKSYHQPHSLMLINIWPEVTVKVFEVCVY